MGLKTRLRLGAALILAPLATAAQAAAPAAAQSAEKEFSLPAGDLGGSLRRLAAQSGEQLIFDPASTAGRQAPAVQGRMTTEEALRRLLVDSPLRAERTGRNVLVIRVSAAPSTAQHPAQLEDVVVTGTMIRGGEGPSPVVVLRREDIDEQGRASVAEVLAALPQNFAGTANEGALQNGADTTGVNAAFASGVNLRGLGSDATLVLVNGRRLAGSGVKADFADLSTLPTSAVERIEVLLDGASALYGSDAVGGVINIILRRDFDGAETRGRLGTVTDGPASEFGFAHLAGRRWTGGGGLLSYEYLDREALPASSRSRAADADLRRFGGSDHRLNFSSPGNIMRFDPATGAYVPAYAIPPGQDGTSLQPGDFIAGGENLENQRAGLNVFGRQTRHSLFGAFHHDVSDRLNLNGDIRYGRREFSTVSAGTTGLVTVDYRNPYFVSPTGATVHQIAYAFRDDIGQPTFEVSVENAAASLGADLNVAGDWRLSAYAAWSRDRHDSESRNLLNTAFLSEAVGRTADNPLTDFSAARDGFFNPFGDGGDSAAAVTAFIASGGSRNQFDATVGTVNIQADGALASLPGGDLRLAIGLNARRETQDASGMVHQSTVLPTELAGRHADRQVEAAFAELRLPLVGEANRRPGLERLELSVAGRVERYDDIGTTSNPKIGLLWAPSPDWLARASWGTSFRAPALLELTERASASPSILPRGSQQVLTMILYGGNPELEPEEATSWTAGVEYRPAGRPDINLSLNWFRIAFDNRIGQPAADSILNALNDPALSPFVRFVSASTSESDRLFVQAILDDPATALADLFPAEAYGAVMDARYVNTARLEVEGLDLAGRYAVTVREDRFDFAASFSYMLRYEATPTPTSLAVSRLDTPNNPVDLRGRASFGWSRGPWGAGVALNYVDGYRDFSGRRIEPWTTADLQLRYTAPSGPLAGLEGAVTVRNVFDADPPFYDSPAGVAYDPSNADVLGRVIALQVTQRW